MEKKKRKEREREGGEKGDFNAEKSCLLSGRTRAYAGSYINSFHRFDKCTPSANRFRPVFVDATIEMSLKRRVPTRETIDAIPLHELFSHLLFFSILSSMLEITKQFKFTSLLNIYLFI